MLFRSYIRTYRTTYKTRNAIKNRNIVNDPNSTDTFKKWVYAANIKLEEAQNSNIDLQKFKDWLKK